MKSHLYIGSIAVASFIQSAIAELPPRVEQLNQRFEQDKAKGLIALNERHLELFRKEMEVATKAKIEELRETAQAASRMSEEVAEADGESLLGGKTIFFKHDRHPEEVSFVFEEDGRAIWAYTGNEAVPRQYKATGKPRQFLLWWPGHEKQPVWEIAVAEDGKTATMRNTANDYTSEGRIEETG